MALDGKWFNELNSQMEITVKGFTVTGTYRTAVAEGPLPPPVPLVGVVDPKPRESGNQSLAWVVQWPHDDEEAGSVTAWSGAYRVVKDKDGKIIDEVIITRWLLTGETSEDWTSTNVGEDVFRRTPPSDEVARRALAIRRLQRPPVAPTRRK